MMVDALVVAVLVLGAFGLVAGAHRSGRRRADLPMMLQRASLAAVALAAALIVLGTPVWLPATLLGPAVVSMMAAGLARDVEDATHCEVILRAGGPASTPTVAGLPQLMAALSLAVAGAIALVVSSDDTWRAPALLSAVVLPLVLGVIARFLGERWQRDATSGFEHELSFWAWELSEDELIALEVRLENSRLARVLGLAPFLVADPWEPAVLQRPPGTGSAQRRG